MSKDSCIVQLAGLMFKLTGVVSPHDRPPVEDMTVQVIFEDDTEQVLVDLSDEFQDELFVQDGVKLPGTEPHYGTLREKFERCLTAYVIANPDDPT